MIKFLRTIFHTFSCKHYTELSSQQLEQPLNQSDRIVFYLHHFVCTFCRRSNRQFKLIDEAAKQIAVEKGANPTLQKVSLSEDSKQKIKNSLSSNR